MDTRTNTRRLRAALLLSASLYIAGAPASAQVPGEGRFVLGGGAITSQGSLPYAPLLSSPTNAISFQALPSAPVITAGVELPLGRLPVSLRLTGTRSLGSDQTGVWGCADDQGQPLACPSILIEVATSIRASLVLAELVGVAPVGPVEVAAVVGGGWSRFAYEWDPSPVGSFSLDPGTLASDAPALSYGVALRWHVARFRTDLSATQVRTSHERLGPDGPRLLTLAVGVPWA